jgi:hypothetical protein
LLALPLSPLLSPPLLGAAPTTIPPACSNTPRSTTRQQPFRTEVIVPPGKPKTRPANALAAAVIITAFGAIRGHNRANTLFQSRACQDPLTARRTSGGSSTALQVLQITRPLRASQIRLVPPKQTFEDPPAYCGHRLSSVRRTKWSDTAPERVSSPWSSQILATGQRLFLERSRARIGHCHSNSH